MANIKAMLKKIILEKFSKLIKKYIKILNYILDLISTYQKSTFDLVFDKFIFLI